MLKIEITLCGGELPQKAMPGAAGYDVKAGRDTVLHTGINKVPLGFSIRPHYQHRAIVMPKAGHLLGGMVAYMTWDTDGKHPCRIDAQVCQTVLDYGHRDSEEAFVLVRFSGNTLDVAESGYPEGWDGNYYIRKSETVAQLIISEEPEVNLTTEADIVINHNQ